MARLSIDLNCDMGESYGRFQIGNDQSVFPLISSSNIACGFHGGDPLHLEKTISMAIANHTRIGAHPSYPDLMGFGRQKMHIPFPQLKALVKYQVAALKGLVESQGAQLAYVKPHGALYNSIAKDAEEAKVVIEAIQEIDPQLQLMGLAGSHLAALSTQMNIGFIAEAFADRKYESDGHLASRNKAGSVLQDPQKIADQVLSIVKDQKVNTLENTQISLQADSICIHGDNPMVLPILEAITQTLTKHDITIGN